MECSSRSFVLFVSSLAIFIDSVAYSIVVPILPLFASNVLHLDPAYIGMLFASSGAGILLVTPLVGIVSDKFGRRLPMLCGLVGMAGATLAFAYATSYWQLYIGRIGQGISGAFTWTISLAIVADVYPTDELGDVMGAIMGCSGLGYLTGPAAGGVLYDRFGWTAPFWLVAALTAIDFGARGCISEAALVEMHNAAHPPNETRAEEFSIREMIRDRNIIVLLFCVFTSSIFMVGIEPIWALHLSASFGSTSSEIGLLFLVVVLPNVASSMFVGWLADRWSKVRLIQIGTLALAATVPTLSIFHQRHELVGFCCCMALVSTMIAMPMTPILPLLSLYVSAKQSRSYAQIYSLWVLAYSAGSLAGPLFAGWMYAATGFTWTMVAMAIVVASPWPLLFFMDDASAVEYQELAA